MTRLLGFLVLLGVGLRVWAYAADVSFWLDEILLGRNIVGLPLGDLLTRPLYLDQVAPRGFLLAERAAVALLGDTELVQRLFPFLCAIAGVFLFRRLAERMLDGWAVPFAVALYAVAIPLIRYSAEVKQYAVDATAAILLLLLALELRERDSSAGRLAVAGVIGFLLPWVSQAAVIVMAGIGAALALRWLTARDPRDRRVLLGVMPVWALAAVIAIAVGRRSMSPSTAAFMDNFWKGGFLPLPFDAERAVHWVWDTALSPFTDPALLRYPLPFLFVLVALLGVAAMWGSRRDAALMLAGPFALALIAAVVQQYPMRGRLMVYLLPGLLIAISAGAEWLRRAAGRLHPAAGAVLMLALLVPPAAALVKVPPPYELEPHRPVLRYLQQHRQPGDAIHAFPLSRIGLLYYGPRYGLRPEEWRTSVCHRTDTRAYVRDVDRYRGVRRLWLISAGVRPFRTARPAVQQYLSTIGMKRDSLAWPSLQFGSVSLELYDLSDSTRLRAANAEEFPVSPMPTDPAPGCRPWSQPSPTDTFP